MLTPHDPLVLAGAAVLAIVAVGRATRLITSDTWPPILAVRLWWLTWSAQTERRRGWAPLLTCPFCATPYVAAVSLTWSLLTAVDWTTWWGAAWWIVHAWAALSYAAAMLVVRDEPPAEETA